MTMQNNAKFEEELTLMRNLTNSYSITRKSKNIAL